MSGYIIEIEREKQAEMAECAEQILRHAGKLMQCIEEIGEESGSMGQRMGERMGYRRGVKGTGRYGMRSSMGYRETPPVEEYHERSNPGMMGYREPYYE